MGDLVIFTTAEVVIGECIDLQYGREDDAETGFPELTIAKRPQRQNMQKTTSRNGLEFLKFS